MNITTNTLLMTGANRCIGRRLVNETLRRGAKKNFYVALVICAIGWAPGTLFPQATQASVGPQSPAASPAPSGQHDFDFRFGTWKTHILLLAHPLSDSTTWIDSLLRKGERRIPPLPTDASAREHQKRHRLFQHPQAESLINQGREMVEVRVGGNCHRTSI
jgi:hypothetical protein